MGDKVDLVKVDVDANQELARAYGVQGIPAVKAFRDGEVVDEFVGAQPAAAVERFFRKLVPSEADALVAAGDEESLRRALELEPGRADAATALGRTLLERGDVQEALEVLDPVKGDFAAEGLAAQARLRLDGLSRRRARRGPRRARRRATTSRRSSGWSTALEEADGEDGEATRDQIRRVIVGDVQRARERPPAVAGVPPQARRGALLSATSLRGLLLGDLDLLHHDRAPRRRAALLRRVGRAPAPRCASRRPCRRTTLPSTA